MAEFSDLAGGVSDFGRLISEELITKFSNMPEYTVVERSQLKKAMDEIKLEATGLLDPKSATKLGKMVGADAIVTGTIAKLGEAYRVNARVFSTETAEVLCGAAVTVADSSGLTTDAPSNEPQKEGESRKDPTKDSTAPIVPPFREDFSRYQDGETTDWGPAGKVRIRADGRHWLVPAGTGQVPIGRNVNLPRNACIEFEYEAEELESKHRDAKALSGITLVDEAGGKYRIEFRVSPHQWYELVLPGGASEGNYYGWPGTNRGSIRLHCEGDRIVVGRVGSHDLAGNVSDFKRFTRLELDMYKGANSMISFTNIKIESLGKSPTAGGGSKATAPHKRSNHR